MYSVTNLGITANSNAKTGFIAMLEESGIVHRRADTLLNLNPTERSIREEILSGLIGR